MAWTNLTYSFGSILTSTKMTQMQANLSAIAADNSGAPEIKAAAINSATIQGIKINRTSISESSQVISALSAWTPSIRWAELMSRTPSSPNAVYRIYHISTWYSCFANAKGFLLFDGTNYQVYNTSSTTSLTMDYRSL